MSRVGIIVPIAVAAVLAGCATVPTGPNVMVLPGNGKSLEQFQSEDALCRQWAAQQVGVTPRRAATEGTASGAAIGTAVGAAGGAAVGAAAGSPATGAAVGSGLGLLGGTAAGAGHGEESRWTVQRRYDVAYMQCMYIKGNQIPVPRGSEPAPPLASAPRAGAYGPPPPPPPGNPPPPPPPR